MIFFELIVSSLVAGFIMDRIYPGWSYKILLDENKVPKVKHPWELITGWPYFLIMSFVHAKRIKKDWNV